MRLVPQAIPGVVAVHYDVRGDERGRFNRTFDARTFADAGIETHFVQANHSVTRGAGTLRGLHFQRGPATEAKLISCLRGAVMDVAVDLRLDSSTYLSHVAVELDDASALYIPRGCAHGFQCLGDEAQLLYLMSAEYQPSLEGGVRFDDPALAIAWPLPPVHVSPRDRAFPLIDSSFRGP